MTNTRMDLGVTLVAALTLLGLSSAGAAHADTFIPLPGGTITRTLGDGTVVTVSIDGESANINPALGDTPLHRNVWTSGRGVVDVFGPKANDSTTSVKLYPGYVVGCQVNIGALGSGTNESGAVDPTKVRSNPAGAFSGTANESETLTIGPGQAEIRYLLDIEKPDDYGQESHKRYHKVPGPHASVTWADETFAVNGCGGYAQARTFVVADVSTDNTESMVTVWGEPFSLG